MDIETLRLMIEIARLGSFAAVARARHIDPSAVSRAVAMAEAELGIRLFQRTTRLLTLTEAGEVYLRRIEAVVDEFDQAQDEAANTSTQPSGTLRMTTSVAFG